MAAIVQFTLPCCCVPAGLDMEGVYRLSPNARIIEALKAEFDKSEFHDVRLLV